MYGIIDIGSNSMHLNIYKRENGKTSMVFTKETAAGLASYVLHGRMTPDGIDKACEVLRDFHLLLEQFNIEAYAFATAALRDADNCQEAIDEITRRTGIQVYILSSEREAELDFIGALFGAHKISFVRVTEDEDAGMMRLTGLANRHADAHQGA